MGLFATGLQGACHFIGNHGAQTVSKQGEWARWQFLYGGRDGFDDHTQIRQCRLRKPAFAARQMHRQRFDVLGQVRLPCVEDGGPRSSIWKANQSVSACQCWPCDWVKPRRHDTVII